MCSAVTIWLRNLKNKERRKKTGPICENLCIVSCFWMEESTMHPREYCFSNICIPLKCNFVLNYVNVFQSDSPPHIHPCYNLSWFCFHYIKTFDADNYLRSLIEFVELTQLHCRWGHDFYDCFIISNGPVGHYYIIGSTITSVLVEFVYSLRQPVCIYIHSYGVWFSRAKSTPWPSSRPLPDCKLCMIMLKCI